jgi:hypothetical protein
MHLTKEISHTTAVIEKPETKTNGGATDKEKEELQNKVAALEMLLEEKDLHVGKIKATTHELKERQRSEIHYIKMKEEMEKSSLLRKIRDMRNEIISLKKRRPRPTERDTEEHQMNKSDRTGRSEAGGGGNGWQWTNQCHRPKEQDFCRNRNLPPRLQTEICHPACKKPSSGTKGIILSNRR